MRKKVIAIAAALLLGLTACSAAEETPEPTATTQTPTEAAEVAPEPTEEFDSEAATAAVDAAIRESLGGQEVVDLCNDEYSNWQCYFDEFEVPHESRLNIHLGFPGDVDEKALAEDARRWAANFLGWTGMVEDKFPDLHTIVTYNSNGLDLGTTTRD